MVGGDRIRMLRAVGAPGDPLALRLRVERALGTANLQPRGLPTRAIVCVRRIRLPMPARDPRGWAARIDRRMQELLPGRARPFLEAVPANADVVVFLDEAEVLACLARDWLRGDGHAWWWRGLLGESASATGVQRAFVEAPAFVPAALELLADRGLAIDVVRRLPPSYCERLGAAVALTFAVQGWTEPPPAPSAPLDARGPGEAAGIATTSPYAAKLAAVLDGVVDAERGTAAPPQRALLAVALLLRRAPALARASGFVAALREWSWSPPPEASSARTVTAASVRLAPPADTARPAPVVRGADGVSPPPDPDGDARESGGESVEGARAVELSEPARIVSGPAPDAVEVPAPAAPATHRSSPANASERRAARAPADGVVVVDSAFAGVVYLVNAALALEIYGDFTQPARPGLALPLGDFLALVGERACGPSFRDDPLWALLAVLAGREEHEAPGRGFVPPDEPAPACGPPADRLPRDPFAHWLDGVVRTLEARAAPALGLREGAALPFLCARSGRVALSPVRLDAIFPLAEHPLEIRLAGLDRNPGWVPAAGRFIELHYE